MGDTVIKDAIETIQCKQDLRLCFSFSMKFTSEYIIKKNIYVYIHIHVCSVYRTFSCCMLALRAVIQYYSFACFCFAYIDIENCECMTFCVPVCLWVCNVGFEGECLFHCGVLVNGQSK